ncbi:MAG: proton-conducting transporter transmembrane domain-containing protein [Leptospirales bacterium]
MLLHYSPLLILLAPLTAALIDALSGVLNRPKTCRFATLAHVVALGEAILVLHQVSATGSGTIRLPILSSSWNFLSIVISIDRLAAVMMVLITGIGTILHLYSIRFMQQERRRAWFHVLLSLAIFVLLFMVSSANLVMLFLFWQLLGWLLSLLAYNYGHASTAQGAFRTFIMLRLGDIAFLAGIILAYHLYGTVDFQQLFLRAAADQTTFSLFWPGSGMTITGHTLVTFLIFIGAMSKSAQFPLHMWLPDSLYAPTPVHALLHAGIINAGGFLMNRLAPLYALSPVALHTAFAVGLSTTMLGACMMLTQNDIKKTLGYSTISQMGYMIMECGLGAFSLAVFHLIAHGLFKATIFLNCGNVIHASRQDPRVPRREETEGQTDFSLLTWVTGFVTTLILPLIILLSVHGVFQISLTDSPGAVIFLFFSWVTSSQAILTLYRLRAIGSWKAAGVMLLMLLLVISTYMLAAERFTYFLYPAPGQVIAFFQAAALPGPIFDAIVGTAAFTIMLYWIVIYTKSHGHRIRIPGQTPEWIELFQARLYLLFMNRLYLDGLVLRIRQTFRKVAERLNRSQFFLPVIALIAIGFAFPAVAQAGHGSLATILLFFLAALILPLFPFHGLYVAALTRHPGSTGILSFLLAIFLPAVGLYALADALPSLPPPFLEGIRTLALFGAFYGSVKALVQVRVVSLLTYGSLVFYSILWWDLAKTGKVTPQASLYAGAAIWVTGGLFLAWGRVQTRYGDLSLNQIGGLARPMPRLTFLTALLVMAAAGLPPFGLFSGYLAMLLSPSITMVPRMEGELILILMIWFMVSWYLFKLLQKLFCGQYRTDLSYKDLRPAEIAPLVMVLLILLALGVAPYGCPASGAIAGAACTAMGFK